MSLEVVRTFAGHIDFSPACREDSIFVVDAQLDQLVDVSL
jgi:hypothetical protein